MKIIEVVPSISYFGVSKAAITQAKALRKLGHEVRILSLTYNPDPPRDLIRGIERDIAYRPDVPFPFLRKTLNTLTSHYALPKLEPADVVIAHSANTALVARRLAKRMKSKFVIFFHDPLRLMFVSPFLLHIKYHPERGGVIPFSIDSYEPTDYPKFPRYHPMRFGGELCTRIERKLAREADLVLAQSEICAKMVGTYCDVDVIPVHLGCFPLSSIPPYRGDYVLCISRLHPDKDFHVVFEAVKKLGEKLILAGAWTDRTPELFRTLRKIGPADFEVVENPTEEQLVRLYAGARVYAHAHREMFGLPALEAAATGCPSIIPKRSGVTELFKDGVHGFFPEEVDSDTYAELIAKLMADERLAYRMGFNSWEESKKHTWRHHAEKLSRLLEEIA